MAEAEAEAEAEAVAVAAAEASTYSFDLWTEDDNTNDVFCVVEMKNYDWWYYS